MIREIEQALINVVKAGIPSFLTVRGYNGDFAAVTEETVSTIIKLFPAALVIFSGTNIDEPGNQLPGEEDMDFAVILAAKSLRGEADPTMRQGLYDLMDEVQELLHQSKVGLTGILPVKFIRQRLLFNSQMFSVYAQEYRVRVV